MLEGTTQYIWVYNEQTEIMAALTTEGIKIVSHIKAVKCH